MADKKNDIVLSIRGMSKSFGRNRCWTTLIWMCAGELSWD